MRIQQFQVSLVNKTRQRLPASLRDFDARSFFSVVKLSFQRPRIHYEVWVRGKERLIEVGLHFEAERTTNLALVEYFDSRAFEVHAELGPRIEIEQWTNSWGRVHEVVPYTALDEELVVRLADKLAHMITVLEPMVRDWPKERKGRAKSSKRSPAASRTAR